MLLFSYSSKNNEYCVVVKRSCKLVGCVDGLTENIKYSAHKTRISAMFVRQVSTLAKKNVNYFTTKVDVREFSD